MIKKVKFIFSKDQKIRIIVQRWLRKKKERFHLLIIK
jgi:hypothetical protein